MSKGKIAAAALGCLLLTCHQAILTAPPGSTVTVFPNPRFIAAHGGVSVITAIVIEPAGTPVADGTVVQFFTDLGRIDEQGRTNDGVARVNLVSDSRSGTANIIAISGGPATAPSSSPSPTTGGKSRLAAAASGIGSDTTTVLIGNPNATRIFVRAEPPRITISRSTQVIATVLDANGNPVPNVPVFFSITQDPLTEFMDGGGPIFTDNNGEAQDVMRTRRPAPSSGTAIVRASVPAGTTAALSGEVAVAIVL